MADGPMPGGAGGGEMGAGEDAATPGAGGVAASVAVAPAPAIVKKVKKVVETRLDAPELALTSSAAPDCRSLSWSSDALRTGSRGQSLKRATVSLSPRSTWAQNRDNQNPSGGGRCWSALAPALAPARARG